MSYKLTHCKMFVTNEELQVELGTLIFLLVNVAAGCLESCHFFAADTASANTHSPCDCVWTLKD